VNWIGLAVKKIKAQTVKKCFAKAGFGESDVMDNLEKASENIAAISNLCRGKELPCDTKDFVWSDDHLATHHSFEPATALLVVRNTQIEDLEDEEEEKGEEAAGEHDISTKIHTREQALLCISEVMQFATGSNSSRLLELLHTVMDCIQKDMNTKMDNKFLCWICGRNLMSCILETCNVQCNRAQYFNNVLLLYYYYCCCCCCCIIILIV
jgi:hypothetical protein